MSLEQPSNLDFTIPLFIQHQFLAGGHDKRTPSATGTFIKSGGKHYVVTCNHVLTAADHAKRMTLAIMAKSGVFNLSYPTRQGSLTSSFRVPLEADAKTEIDVGISGIGHAWEYLAQHKGKRAIDLDDWVEPEWSKIKYGTACGWLDNYKEEQEEKLAVSGVQVLAEVQSDVSPDRAQFTMHSATAKMDHPSLSGISGGAIFASEGGRDIPFGIVFEGYPGAPRAGGAPDAFMQPGDLMVRGHVLTPAVFQNWLASLK